MKISQWQWQRQGFDDKTNIIFIQTFIAIFKNITLLQIMHFICIISFISI